MPLHGKTVKVWMQRMWSLGVYSTAEPDRASRMRAVPRQGLWWFGLISVFPWQHKQEERNKHDWQLIGAWYDVNQVNHQAANINTGRKLRNYNVCTLLARKLTIKFKRSAATTWRICTQGMLTFKCQAIKILSATSCACPGKLGIAYGIWI